jgi:hypothetical protein
MARIAGVEIPRNKKIEIAITYIFGIGRSRCIVGPSGNRRGAANATDVLTDRHDSDRTVYNRLSANRWSCRQSLWLSW